MDDENNRKLVLLRIERMTYTNPRTAEQNKCSVSVQRSRTRIAVEEE